MKSMSLVNARQFIQAMEADTALQTRITAANWSPTVIQREAAARQLAFSAAEFETALDEVFGTLSEETLVNAAGGKSEEAGSDDHLNPPPGQDPGGNDTWSPPPGDVSGNSCLFGWRDR
jgi:hypothetical protein